jgi:type I restriction enzyme S subunit
MSCEWKILKISDLGEIVGGSTPSTKDENNYGGNISWITPKDLSNFNSRFIDRGERNITQTGLKNCSSKILPKGTVLFSSRAPIGYLAIAKNDLCTNQGFKSVIPNKNTDSMFLYYLLLHNKNKIESMGSGTTFKEVSGATMKNIELLAPDDKNIQKTIAATLSCLDDKIELNNRINKTLEEMAQAIFRSWFVDFEPFQDEKFIESELGEIPASWRSQPIGCVAEKIAMGPFGSNIKVETFMESGVPIISGNHLRGLFLDEQSFNYISEEHAHKLRNSLVYAGDIIFTHAGNIGQVALIPDDCEYPYYIISQRQFYLRCDKEKALPEYINYYFHGREGQGQLLANTSSTGVPSIARPSSHLKSIAVPIPPIKVQREWLNIVSPMLRTITCNIKENRKLSTTRDTLLPKLMSGEICVPMEV